MNQKTAEKLRRIVERSAVGYPNVAYKKTNRGMPVMLTIYCKRYIYKQYKKAPSFYCEDV